MSDYYDDVVVYTASLLQTLVQKGRLSAGSFSYTYRDAIEASDVREAGLDPPIHQCISAAKLITGFCDMRDIGTDAPPTFSVLHQELAALASPKETTQ